MKDTYRISELAEKVGVTKRTIRYYVGRGLLPPPEGAGVGSTYSEEHLVKLKLIKQLQEGYYPLDQIRNMIANMSLEEAKQQLDKPETLSKSFGDLAGKTDNNDAGMIALLEAAPSNTTAVTIAETHRRYVRCSIGLGIELHVPQELARDNPVLIDNIEKYVRKLTSEK